MVFVQKELEMMGKRLGFTLLVRKDLNGYFVADVFIPELNLAIECLRNFHYFPMTRYQQNYNRLKRHLIVSSHLIGENVPKTRLIQLN